MNLGANIKKVRKSAGVTQKELAERLQVYLYFLVASHTA